MENKPTLVIALGGNALLKRGEPLEAEIQRKNIDLAAKTIAQLTQHFWHFKIAPMPMSLPIHSTFWGPKARG